MGPVKGILIAFLGDHQSQTPYPLVPITLAAAGPVSPLAIKHARSASLGTRAPRLTRGSPLQAPAPPAAPPQRQSAPRRMGFSGPGPPSPENKPSRAGGELADI